MDKPAISDDDSTITVTIPMVFKKRGGRRLMIAPDGAHLNPSPRARIDNPLQKALIKAFRWKQMMESGAYATLREMARAENCDAAHISHVMRLTLLAPDLVQAIFEGRQPPAMQLQPLLRDGFPLEWKEQKAFFAGA